MKSKDTEERSQLHRAISFNRKSLLEGDVIAIDPSSGSRESLPGFAIFSKGKLIRSGVIEVPVRLMRGLNYTPHRLQWISKNLTDTFPQTFDVLIMEGIHFKTNAKTNPKSFQQLNQAIGAIIGGLRWNYIVNIYPWHWKELLSGVYEKGDAMDAINIGTAVMRIAKGMGAPLAVTSTEKELVHEEEFTTTQVSEIQGRSKREDTKTRSTRPTVHKRSTKLSGPVRNLRNRVK